MGKLLATEYMKRTLSFLCSSSSLAVVAAAASYFVAGCVVSSKTSNTAKAQAAAPTTATAMVGIGSRRRRRRFPRTCTEDSHGIIMCSSSDFWKGDNEDDNDTVFESNAAKAMAMADAESTLQANAISTQKCATFRISPHQDADRT